jgi:HEAT repeat protein
MDADNRNKLLKEFTNWRKYIPWEVLMAHRFTVVTTVLFILIWVGCGDRSAENDTYGEMVRIAETQNNPVDHALNILGLDATDLVRPHYQEENYHLGARLPIVDHVAQSPFYLHHWADDTSNKLQNAVTGGLSAFLATMIDTLNDDTGVPPKKIKGAIVAHTEGLYDAYRNLCRSYQVDVDNAVQDKIKRAGFSESFDEALGNIVFQLTQASLLAKDAFASLSREEVAYLSQRPEMYFFPEGPVFNFLTAPTHVPRKIVSITRKIDFVKLYDATTLLAAGIDGFVGRIQRLGNSHPRHFFGNGVVTEGIVIYIATPIGNVVILGPGDDVFAGTGALVIDLGGNDRYTGSVADGRQAPGRVALTIDVAGNDTYDRGDSRYGLGFGHLSVGALVDLAGSDKYLAGNLAQGCGIYGVGVLADFQGNDFYQMGMLGQGFGVFGLGLLLDADGSDRYIISGLGQGVGSTMGFGLLSDIRGNDKYLADRSKKRGRLIPDDWSHVQGVGLSIRSPEWDRDLSFYGGIGFLSDGGGNDIYFASHGNCMGSSYFMSIGALVDHAGNDKYIPQNGLGTGWAVHLSNAILIDRKGHDSYYGHTHSGGVASDRSVAMLVDYQGNDTYGPTEEYIKAQIEQQQQQSGETLADTEVQMMIDKKMALASYGSAMKPKALGLLIDYQGEDRYFASTKPFYESCGGVVPPTEPNNWSYAILFDLGGKDFYSKPGRKNNHYYKYMNHGLCYDTDFAGKGMPAKLLLSPPNRDDNLHKSLYRLFHDSPMREDLIDLLNPNLWVRYEAAGRIIQNGAVAVPVLVRGLIASSDNEINRNIIEVIDTLILTGKLKRHQFRQLEILLDAQDPFVQIFAARTLGLWKIRHAIPNLKQTYHGANNDVRAHIIWALGQLGPASADLLISAARNDPSENCRREAIAALNGLVEGKQTLEEKKRLEITESLLQAFDDGSDTVRTLAARGLRYSGGNSSVMRALDRSLGDESIYVQRAAAHSLILKGQKEAIPILIESLKFPSIDTFKHYDHEIANDLAFYCGIDFPENDRYAYNTWNKWWLENGDGVNLAQNLKIMQTIEGAFSASNEEKGIAIFEQLLSDHPQNLVIRKRYILFCNEWINMRLLTRAHVNQEIFGRCLRLQQKLTQLEPESAERWVRLAYFNYRLSKFESAAAAMQKAHLIAPENASYRETLNHYRTLKKKNSN